MPVDDVHFHEIADWDSLMDVVAAGAIAAALDGARWTASDAAARRRHGADRARHAAGAGPGDRRAPRGLPWRDDGVGGERVTPTGAAILRHLVPATACGARRDGGRLVATGIGAGTRDAARHARTCCARWSSTAATVDGDAADGDDVAVLEFDIDDMTGEEIAHRRRPAARDAGRARRLGRRRAPARRAVRCADFRVLARPGAAEAVAQSCFTETSTLGLRMREERRRTLARERSRVRRRRRRAGQGRHAPGGERTAKAENDDVVRHAGPRRAAAARAAGEARALGEADE